MTMLMLIKLFLFVGFWYTSHAFRGLLRHSIYRYIDHKMTWSSLGHLRGNSLIHANTRQTQDDSPSLKSAAKVSSPVLGLALLGIYTRTLMKRWITVDLWKKFVDAGALRSAYATIPIVAAIVNYFTNMLSVWMIFNPIEFIGREFVKRRPGQPLGLIGWQGIVPAKAAKMGNDVCSTLLQLISIECVFARLPVEPIAETLASGIESVIDEFLRVALYEQIGLPMNSARLYASSQYLSLRRDKTLRCVRNVLEKVQRDPTTYIDLRRSVSDEIIRDKRTLCRLFQVCGRQELRFIVKAGLFGGFALGVVQMLLWLMYTPVWTLVAGGAAVGYITDLVALQLLFAPVEPRQMLGGLFVIQGLFLKRQQEVSGQFATLVTQTWLSGERLWTYILSGSRSNALREEIEHELRRELAWALPVVRDVHWASLAGRVQRALVSAAVPLYNFTSESLQIEEDIADAMRCMPAAQFEQVLHPIFEEDEATLIAVGTLLGAAAGLIQARFY